MPPIASLVPGSSVIHRTLFNNLSKVRGYIVKSKLRVKPDTQ